MLSSTDYELAQNVHHSQLASEMSKRDFISDFCNFDID